MTFSGSAPSFDQLLTRSAAVVLGAALVWVLVLLVAVLLEAVTEGRVRFALALGCPRSLHRWLLAVAGAAMSATVLVPAAAQALPSPPGEAPSHVLDGLPLPDRTVGGPAAAPVHPSTPPTSSASHPRAQTPVPVSAWVTVRAGDSLWEISRSLLPPASDPLRIAQHADQLYAINLSTIGEDPDRIRPGQRLVVPPSASTTYSEDS